MKNFILIVVFLTCISDLFGQVAKVTGYYLSNPAMQMSAAQIQLNHDGTFKFQYVEHMGRDIGKGKYKVHSDTIILEFFPEKIDTQLQIIKDSTGKEIKLFLGNRQDESRYWYRKPNKLYFKKGKLFIVRADGKLENFMGDILSKNSEYYLERRRKQTWQNW